MLIRHGDRGPLQHIKNISNVNCGGISGSTLLNSYKVITLEVECNSSVVVYFDAIKGNIQVVLDRMGNLQTRD